MYVCMCMLYIYTHIICTFCIYLSVSGHLGCFPVLAIVNSAAMNIRVHVSFQISFQGFFFNIYAQE